MALFFFHLQTDSYSTDRSGIELVSAAEARAQAIITCGQMLKDDPNNFWGSRPWSVTVANEAGLILWQLSMDGFASPAGEAIA